MVQGKRYHFALDTGSSHSCYDTSFRSLLGDPIRTKTTIWTPDRDITGPVFRSPAAKLGKLELPTDSEAYCLDFSRLRELYGREIDGLIGMDFLKDYVIRIDFDRGEVTFLRSVGANPGHRMPITFQGNYPHVMVEASGLVGQGRFLIDTGSAGFGSGSLQREAFDILARLGKLRLAGESKPESFAVPHVARVGHVERIWLGHFNHEKLQFSESRKNILGLNYWARYVVTFDFPNSAIYLKEGRRFNQPEPRDLSGLRLIRKKGQTLVESVVKDSPAAQAGIKPQDVLLRINDVAIGNMSNVGLLRLFRPSVSKYRVRVRRGEEEMEMVIVIGEEK
jgi:hypothetical protein